MIWRNEFDHVSLYVNQNLYAEKGSIPGLFFPIKSNQNYGHCNFPVSGILAAIELLQPNGA